jgi:hypothetical protein
VTELVCFERFGRWHKQLLETVAIAAAGLPGHVTLIAERPPFNHRVLRAFAVIKFNAAN